MVCSSFLHYTSLCISCDKNLGEFLMLCFVLWALCCTFLSIKIYVCTWVGFLFVNISLSTTVKQMPSWNNARLVCNSAKTLKDTILTAVTPLLQTSNKNSLTNSVQLLTSLVVCWLISFAIYLILVLVSLDKQTWGWEMEEPKTSVKSRSPMTVIKNGGRTEKSQKRKGERQT